MRAREEKEWERGEERRGREWKGKRGYYMNTLISLFWMEKKIIIIIIITNGRDTAYAQSRAN